MEFDSNYSKLRKIFAATNIQLAVSVDKKQYPESEIPEIALVGRSNVGKSSLLNCLMGRKNFARTSKQPGKTATINFYTIGDKSKIRLVDLPGYGYAKVSHKEQERWKKMINYYLENRHQLKMICLLVDSRHTPSQDDILMWDYMKSRNDLSNLVIATKSDKLSKLKLIDNLKNIKSVLDLNDQSQLIPFSSVHKIGCDDVASSMMNGIK